MNRQRPTKKRSLWFCIALSAIATLASASHGNASPCEGVDRSLTTERKAALAPAISQQLHLPKVTVLQSFRDNDWSIIYVQTFVSDETFLFFSGDPLNNHYITKWSGGASPSEEKDIKVWMKKNLPDIPEKLAGCFAYHVTRDRDM
ncbi:hypothetical protein F2P47_14480 [Parvibaculum sedimenti]|uniref:Disulphide bond isomerase DsbC/G N-terminal domain-containing protein n=1 Tax=Parvibaculum sedimenti TaxID=2608632 RepID=A0A6N6VKF7_9HYPH|nr:hypothetical protein [Parvibaculum sedimenti]KAB7739001.1 hypothetical protein F2P47_14480 [Parvibaculum sedimenti]